MKMETDEAQFRPFLAPATASGSPPKKELKDYPVRDFRSSHLYRIGLHLFKTSDFRCRRRILIAAPRESSSVQLERKNKDFSCQSKANFTGKEVMQHYRYMLLILHLHHRLPSLIIKITRIHFFPQLHKFKQKLNKNKSSIIKEGIIEGHQIM